MATITLTQPASKVFTLSPMPELLSANFQTDDWRAELAKNGFAVVKNAIPYERAVRYQQRAFEWLKSFGNDDLDLSNPNTWVKANLPKQSSINTFASYCVGHERFMWDARMEPGVIDAFAKVWGTDELLVSFDSLNVTLPNRKDIERKEAWEHVDQSPLRRGLHCVQGIINLSTSGPEDGGLVVYPGSSASSDEFFDNQTDSSSWTSKDIFFFNKKELEWFTARGIKPYKVCAGVGDLILWDSRTIHYGAEPTQKSNTIRTVFYASMTPAKFATPEDLALRAEAFQKYLGTSHWPHTNIFLRPHETYLEDGTRDPRDRDQPRELPEINDRMLQLVGIKSY